MIAKDATSEAVDRQTAVPSLLINGTENAIGPDRSSVVCIGQMHWVIGNILTDWLQKWQSQST